MAKIGLTKATHFLPIKYRQVLCREDWLLGVSQQRNDQLSEQLSPFHFTTAKA